MTLAQTSFASDDPAHGNQATVGEVWRYAELPALMRNTNIQTIYSFYWSSDRSTLDFHEEWNVDRVGYFSPPKSGGYR